MSNEERIKMLEKEASSMQEELSALREEENVNQEVLDANVMSIHNRIAKKRNTTMLCFSAIVSCALLVVSQIIANKGYSWNTLSICVIVISISAGIMIITIIND